MYLMDKKIYVQQHLKMLVEIAHDETFPSRYEINLGEVRGSRYSLVLTRDENSRLRIDLAPHYLFATEQIHDLELEISHVPADFIDAIHKKIDDIEALASVFVTQ